MSEGDIHHLTVLHRFVNLKKINTIFFLSSPGKSYLSKVPKPKRLGDLSIF